MAMKYFNQIKQKAPFIKTHDNPPPNEAPADSQHQAQSPSKPHAPVLSDEDEKFLRKVSQAGHGGDAQIALMDGAQNIPLPASPREEVGQDEIEGGLDKAVMEEEGKKEEEKEEKVGRRKSTSKKWAPWSWVKGGKGKDKEEDIAEEPPAVDEEEIKKEQADVSEVLEKLNLAAINNRVFSISDETQELLEKFKFIFKDLVNGVPTAYRDLEDLLTNGDEQLEKTFGRMPDFLKKLIQQLPDKFTEKLGPEFFAAAAEKAEKSGVNAENAKKMGIRVPSLREVVGKPAALAGMLRSIMTFLRARFPALMGMNILWSLALMLLLVVLWYCHKRGREERLGKQRSVQDQEDIDPTKTSTSTTPENAPIETGGGEATEAQPTQTPLAPSNASPASPAAAQEESPRQKEKKIEAYEGT